ncbi:MAG TPA: tetratricopeptide repeat protein [Thermoanaerobaculia bacterium]|nr:tetratricopeptide repeat protein [Thermoanaerobaculia bacterium]
MLALLALASAPETLAQPLETTPGTAGRSAEQPDLSRFSPQIRRHLEAREAWRERILRNAQATPQQKSAADGELAMLYHAFQLYAGAEQLYLRVLETTPEHRWAYYLAQLYRSTNRLEESVRRFIEALGRASDDVPTLVRLAEVYLDLDREGEAEPLLENALALSPETAAVHYYLGQIAAARGRPDLAAVRFERALELQPSSTALHSPLGLAYRDQGRLEEARRHLAAAGTVDIALDDPLMERLHALSQTLWELLRDAGEKLDQGDREGAIAALDQAAAIDPLAPEPRLLLGQLLATNADRAAEAERQLELAAFLDPTDGRADALLAALLRARDAPERAIARYREALERMPDAGLVRFELAQTLQSARRLDEAAAEYAHAARLLGDNPIALLGEATVLLELDRCSLAKQRIEEGLERVPNQGVWAHALVRILSGCRELDPAASARALDLGQTLFAVRPTPGHAAAIAMTHAAWGRFPEALEWQQRAVNLARQIGRDDLATGLETDLALYRAGRERGVPWRVDEMDLFSAGIGSSARPDADAAGSRAAPPQ